MMVRAYLNVRATGGAVFFPMRGENTRERWSPFKGEGDGGCSKRCYEGIIIVLSNTGEHLILQYRERDAFPQS